MGVLSFVYVLNVFAVDCFRSEQVVVGGVFAGLIIRSLHVQYSIGRAA